MQPKQSSGAKPPETGFFPYSGKSLILEYVRRLRERADRLEKLAEELPILGKEADDALWELLENIRPSIRGY